MDILTIISIIKEYTVEPVGRQVSYLIHYKINFENMRSQLENLDVAKDRMTRMVDEDERKGKKVHIDVQKWLTEANKMIQEANKFLDDADHAKTKCFPGVCPNLVSYHQLSRKSIKLAKNIELHHDEKKEFSIVSYNPPLEEIFDTPSEDYMAFESRISMVNKIMVKLRNPGTNLVGVYGLGGVGKTRLAQEVYRQAKKEKLFVEVVIVLDVKKYPHLEKEERIQKKIAEQLGMDVDETQDIDSRAKHLWNRIKDKNIFVILDDIWEAIDLEVLGLRQMETCKILLTSRDRVSHMGMHEEFWLDVLGVEETWSLFEKMAGDIVKNDGIHEVATKIAKKCGGLPVLVVAVARSLRSESSLAVWRASLRDFKSFDKQGLATSAYLALEWSYNRLEGCELKPLFLLCGIIAGGDCTIPLNDLLKYAMGLGLVKNVDTVEEARDKLISLVKKLTKDYCLLLDIDDDGDIRMHELVRDVAIGIASKDNHAIAKAYGDELKEWPDRDSLKKCTAISLNSCKIPRLPEVPWVCPKLRFFLLENHNIDDSVEIPDKYFEGMKELKVLDVTKLRIPSLPQSLQSLTNLQTLCLDHCVLGDIALVGQLTNLNVLSLLKSKVKELPKEIGQLTRLQLLDLTGCSELVLISPGVISSLTSLEDLRMGSFKEWEGGLIDGRSNASVSELKQLRQLTALEIHIPDAKVLPANMFEDTKLERYTLLIGDCWLYPKNYRTSYNMLKLKLTTNNQFDQGIQKLLKTCEHLSLDGMEAANVISHILACDSGKRLKKLRVQNSEVTSVINSISRSYSHTHAFPILELLSLDNLGLSSKGSSSIVTTGAEEIISENEIGGPTKVFMNGEVLMPNLTRLILHQCDGLRFLFSSSMAKSLEQLEHIEISKCQTMEEIVSTRGYNQEHTDKIFPKLKHLQLQHLPSLTRFCSRSYIEFSLLEILHIDDCPRLGTFIFDGKSEITTMGKENDDRNSKENLETVVTPHFLFDEKVGFPSLERLIIHDLPALSSIWHGTLAPNSFCKLSEVQVFRCDTLINIFTPSMMGRLNALGTLIINQCKSLQLVFYMGVKEASLGEGNYPCCSIPQSGCSLRTTIFSPKKEEIYGTSRTELKTFGCPNLGLVVMDSCESLKNIFPASVAKGLQQLCILYVEKCGILEEIVAKEGVETRTTTTDEFVFPKVKLVEFRDLPQLRSFYPGLHVSKWPLLKSLRFVECGKVEIFASEYSRFQERLDSCTTIKQPFLLVDKVLMNNLTRLILDRCDGLRFLFSFSMATSLVQLTHLEISRCQIMEEIVTTIGSSEENRDDIFRKLKHLQLQHLPSLTRFCSGSYVEFPSLELFHLEDCSELGVFIFHSKIENVIVSKQTEERDMKDHIVTDVQCFLLDDKVGFPSLERLMIYDMPKLMTIWHRKLAPDSFRKLKKVEVFKCQSLISIFAPSIMGRLNALNTLKIKQCKSLQVVFEQTYDTSTTKLKTFECPNLDLVEMDSCESLKNIFPASVAKGLLQLGHLHVENCGKLKEIVAKEGVETTPEFVFPNVTCVRFTNLPQLRSFYPELHVSKWPLLKMLLFRECGKVEIFASEYSRVQERLDSGQPNKQPFLLVDKGNSFPNLEFLTLDGQTEIWYEVHGPLPAELFINLKGIGFSCAYRNSFAFLEKLHGLEQLVVDGAPWKEIFVYERTSSGEIDAIGRTLPHIKNLCLKNMEELMHLGNDNSESIFPNLETLKVWDCGRLNNLTSSAISFRNLTEIEVRGCEGLKYLTTYSVAKCLHQLKKLVVVDCKSMKEIVASNGDEQDSGNYDEIAFSSLQHLKLCDLPILRGFCSSEICNIRVPSLNSLIVKKCLIKLKISPDKSLIQSSSRPERQQIIEDVEEENDSGNSYEIQEMNKIQEIMTTLFETFAHRELPD